MQQPNQEAGIMWRIPFEQIQRERSHLALHMKLPSGSMFLVPDEAKSQPKICRVCPLCEASVFKNHSEIY